MTEELENKLNELLGIKKQLEELTNEKKKSNTSRVIDQYKKEAKSAKVRFWIAFVLGLVNYSTFVGLAACIHGNDFLKYIFIGIGILSLSFPGFGKIGLLIRQNKLTVLQELKQMEMRIVEAIQEKL